VGITTGGKIGLGVVALVFIGFALLASFVLPRRNPDFPGDRLRSFIWVTVLLFVALMAAVVVFARESEEEAHAGETVAHETTETGETGETTGETGEEPAPPAGGDAAAGEEVFAANCGSCHTLEAAGTTGAVGPNLDESQPDVELVVDRVTNGKGAMPSFSSSLSEKQIADVAAYVVESTSG
jgi:mono/diheme cytochrome c family protein